MPLGQRNRATAAVEEWFVPGRRAAGSISFRTLVAACSVAMSISYRLVPARA